MEAETSIVVAEKAEVPALVTEQPALPVVDAGDTVIVVPKTEAEEEKRIAVPIPVATDIVVVARNSAEMAQARTRLVAWATDKVAEEKALLKGAEEKFELAKKMHQARAGYAKIVAEHREGVVFYEKVKVALEHGYCIVPNFPIELLAVRTNAVEPDYAESLNNWTASFDVDPMRLPAGMGNYVGPAAKVSTKKRTDLDKDGKPVIKTVRYTSGFRPVTFPARLAKMEILEDLGRAQRVKVFDSIGMLPKVRRNPPDPMLIGQIHQRLGPYSTKTISFMIAWWIDTASL